MRALEKVLAYFSRICYNGSMIEDRYKRLTSALEQYNEGAITYVEFVNLTQCLMTDEDIAEYMQFVTPGEN